MRVVALLHGIFWVLYWDLMAESAPLFGEPTSLSLYPAMTDVHSHVSEIDPPSDEDVQRLIQAAISARDHAYAPQSHFYVGAALLTHDGRIVEGCNVENASYSLTQCAERTAVCTAVAGGYRMFHAVAIASIGGAMPCGACRQVLAEFGSDLFVYTIDVIDGDQQMRRLSDLLPDAFSTSNIPKR